MNKTYLSRKLLYVGLCLGIILIVSCKSAPTRLQYRNGDIVFQTCLSNQSRAIQLATHSRYSHVGIIYIYDSNPVVYEAVGPVKSTPLKEWIRNGENKHYVVKRLKNADQILNAKTLRKMLEVGKGFEGLPYDFLFGWKDDKIYCSELVWKIYKRAAGVEVGKLQKLKDFDLTHPAVKQKLYERYGDNVPLQETVISPSAVFESDKLVKVYEG